MRRAELVEACAAIISALKESEVGEALDALHEAHMSSQGSPARNPTDWAKILGSMSQYAILASRFDEVERHAAKILNLEKLTYPDTWKPPSMNRDPSQNVRDTWRLARAVHVAEEFLPRFMELIAQTASNASDEASRLRVLLIEEEGQRSSPERLIKLFQGVQELYEVCATLEDAPHHSLSVVACDSGSDKSFDFLGVAKVIECLKVLIISLWDRVVFFRERQLEARIEAVTKALPVLERIQRLKEEKAIDPSEAEQLKKKVLGGAGKLLESGVVTPEINAHKTYNPRQLMAPEIKLLTTGSATPKPKNGGKKGGGQLPKTHLHPNPPMDAEFEEGEAPMVDEWLEADEHRTDSRGRLRDTSREPAIAQAGGTGRGGRAKATTDGENPGGLTPDEASTLMRLMAKAKGENLPAPEVPKGTKKLVRTRGSSAGPRKPRKGVAEP